MNDLIDVRPSRGQIGIRFLFSLLFLIVFEILKLVVQVTVIFQFVYLLITRTYSEPLRAFSNKVATYAYKIVRYTTLNENTRPFPMTEFPQEMEPPAQAPSFD
jgi:predicted membrane protein